MELLEALAAEVVQAQLLVETVAPPAHPRPEQPPLEGLGATAVELPTDVSADGVTLSLTVR